MKLINEIITDLEERLLAHRNDIGESGLNEKIEIEVLGQMSLLMNPQLSKRILLAATADIDARLKGRWAESKIFRDVLGSKKLRYDELSTEVWLPADARFIEYYDSLYVRVSYLDPISALTSKAIKAKEKKSLIGHALKIYGDDLATKIKNHGGDVNYFNVTKPLKL